MKTLRTNLPTKSQGKKVKAFQVSDHYEQIAAESRVFVDSVIRDYAASKTTKSILGLCFQAVHARRVK